ncbi:DUF6843 domain-containing protein [Flavobacterium pedocola]
MSKKILFLLSVIFCGVIVSSCYKTVEPEVFLIPEKYRGKVNIIHKKNCGLHLEKTNEGLVYQIPSNGILIVDNEQEYGTINHEYFLVDKNGKRLKLPKMDVRDFNEEWTLEKNANEPSRNKLGVFHWGRTGTTGKVLDENGKEINKDEQYTFLEFYIGTYNDLSEKFDFKYERKFDSILEAKIKECK